MTSSPPPDNRPPASSLADALAFLRGSEAQRSPEQLREALHRRFRDDGHQALADLVYEMVKACLCATPDVSNRIEMGVEPRRAEVISGDVTTIGARLSGVETPPDLGSVARTTPDAEHALEDARRCLVVLEALEGTSIRQQLAAGLAAIYADQIDDAEEVFRSLSERDDIGDELRFYALWNWTFALMRLERNEEAGRVAEEAHDLRPNHPGPFMNIATAAAKSGNTERFGWAMDELAAIQRRDATPFVQRWHARHTPYHAAILGLGAEDTATVMALMPG